MATPNSRPENHEILEQLDRMQNSDLFMGRKKPSQALRFLVEAVLEDPRREIHSHDIANHLYPGNEHSPGKAGARVTANYMRDLVKAYNLANSHMDDVIIEFPSSSRGPISANYRPVFRYNPEHDRRADLKSAISLLSRTFPHGLRDLGLYVQALSKHCVSDSQLVEYRITAAGCFLVYDMLFPEPGLESLPDFVHPIVESIPKCWCSWILQAMLALGRYQIEEARRCFQEALDFDLLATQKHAAYHAFLFAVEREREAFALSEMLLQHDPLNPMLNALHGLWCLKSDPLYANDLFDQALNIDFGCNLAWLGKALFHIDGNENDSALSAIQVLEMPDWDRNRSLYPYLRARAAFNPSSDWECPIREHEAEFPDKSAPGDHHPFLALQEAIAYSHVSLDELNGIRRRPGDLIEENHSRAILTLEQQLNENNPLMMWLHMMPFFERLTVYNRFQDLLHRRLEPPPEYSDWI